MYGFKVCKFANMAKKIFLNLFGIRNQRICHYFYLFFCVQPSNFFSSNTFCNFFSYLKLASNFTFVDYKYLIFLNKLRT
jgi:hypothetical protein